MSQGQVLRIDAQRRVNSEHGMVDTLIHRFTPTSAEL